jgi:hypothetical protein
MWLETHVEYFWVMDMSNPISFETFLGFDEADEFLLKMRREHPHSSWALVAVIDN